MAKCKPMSASTAWPLVALPAPLKSRLPVLRDTRTGWVAGAGIEWAFATNWMVRAEYMHVDLGTAEGTVLLPAVACAGTGPCGMSYSRDLTYDMGRVGLS